LGYKNYTQLMNAKSYGIPQNRNRCFMVSILGDYDYIFPPELPLQYRLKDLLERRVDEKYYLSDRTIEMFIEHTAKQQANNGVRGDPNGARLQGVRQPSNERCGGENAGADGIMVGKSPSFQRGPLKDVSHAIMTDGMNGVIEWQKNSKS